MTEQHGFSVQRDLFYITGDVFEKYGNPFRAVVLRTTQAQMTTKKSGTVMHGVTLYIEPVKERGKILTFDVFLQNKNRIIDAWGEHTASWNGKELDVILDANGYRIAQPLV